MSVRVETKALADVRFKIAGKLIKDPPPECIGIGVAVYLWEHCTQLGTQLLPKPWVRAYCDPQILVDAGLAEHVEGDENDVLRIRGTKGRIEWLQKLKENAKKGGQARGLQLRSQKGTQPDSPPVPVPVPTKEPPIVPRGGTAKGPKVPDSEVQEFLELFKRHFGKARVCTVSSYRDLYRAARKKFTAAEIRAASWAGSQLDEEARDNCTPKTILRLKSKKNALPDWLETANELWAQSRPDETPPWEVQITAPLSTAAGNGNSGIKTCASTETTTTCG